MKWSQLSAWAGIKVIARSQTRPQIMMLMTHHDDDGADNEYHKDDDDNDDDDDACKGPGPKVGSCAVEHDFYSFVCISRLLIQQPRPIKRW